MTEQKQIEELFKDLCEAPTGGVNEDFTLGTLKESHTDLFIRTVAGHLGSLNYHKQSEGEWVDKPTGAYGRMQSYCTACGKHSGIGGIESNRHKPFCPNCGAKMKGR